MKNIIYEKGKIILFEGYDGAGKTTLISLFKRHLSSKGLSSLVIDNTGNRVTANIDFAIRDGVLEIAPATEILLRLARECERIKTLKTEITKYNYIILDRGIVSLISWIHYYNLPYEKYKLHIEEIIEEMSPCYLVDCYLNYDESWNRVLSRGNLSKKESRGKEINNRAFTVQREIFSHFNWPEITKYEINTKGSREDCLQELLACLSLK
ncbi:AAA family ATPase [Candidatus Parcubacteria bacterium]|nr:AAA family ATPase [Patescibacteria group bacterium]MBU4466624.1 AAA family ATPase [Patescibacteria group bacterium]MCG2688350.1 AAA family ATPase [Candidatus Parcubacteria bacterium]